MIQLAWRDERSYWINLTVPSYSKIHSRGILVQTCLDLTMYSKIRHRRLRKNNCLGNTLRYHLIFVVFQNTLNCILTLIITHGNCIKLWDHYSTCLRPGTLTTRYPDTPTPRQSLIKKLRGWEAERLGGYFSQGINLSKIVSRCKQTSTLIFFIDTAS